MRSTYTALVLANILLVSAQTLTDPPTAGGGAYQFVGCWTDDAGDRTLRYQFSNPALGGVDNMTADNCANACTLNGGYTWMGIEYHGQCFCDGGINNPNSAIAAFTDCSTACTGDSTMACGGPNRLSLYSPAGSGQNLNTVVTTTTTTTTAAAGQTQDPISAGYGFNFIGCYSDAPGDRTLRYLMDNAAIGGESNQTVENCATACAEGGYGFMGLEYYSQCFCDTVIYSQDYEKLGIAACNTPCYGNKAEMCGGPNALSMYEVGGVDDYNLVVTTTTTTQAANPTYTGTPINLEYANPGNYQFLGCFTDYYYTGGAHTLEYPYIASVMYIEECASICNTDYSGGDYMGILNGDNCYCGNGIVPSNVRITATGPAGYSCNTLCSDNSTEICGGIQAMSVYSRDPAQTYPNDPNAAGINGAGNAYAVTVTTTTTTDASVLASIASVSRSSASSVASASRASVSSVASVAAASRSSVDSVASLSQYSASVSRASAASAATSSKSAASASRQSASSAASVASVSNASVRSVASASQASASSVASVSRAAQTSAVLATDSAASASSVAAASSHSSLSSVASVASVSAASVASVASSLASASSVSAASVRSSNSVVASNSRVSASIRSVSLASVASVSSASKSSASSVASVSRASNAAVHLSATNSQQSSILSVISSKSVSSASAASVRSVASASHASFYSSESVVSASKASSLSVKSASLASITSVRSASSASVASSKSKASSIASKSSASVASVHSSLTSVQSASRASASRSIASVSSVHAASLSSVSASKASSASSASKSRASASSVASKSRSSASSSRSAASASKASVASVLSVAEAAPTAFYRYDGCFNYDTTTPPLNLHPTVHSLTLELCGHACYNHTYLGVVMGSQCYCGDTITSSPVVVDQCFGADQADPCLGSSAENCGGFSGMAVYGRVKAIGACPAPSVTGNTVTVPCSTVMARRTAAAGT